MPSLLRLPTLALFLAGSFLARAQEVLKVGSPAPPLQVSRWIKGKGSLDRNWIEVVEFWATWCGPCRRSIPHLTELAKKYDGKVTFIGVNIWEKGPDPDRTVDAFVREMGENMAYAVARDTRDGVMARTWMKAANRTGIPTAFIINQQGNIAWIGNPLSPKMEVALEAVLASR